MQIRQMQNGCPAPANRPTERHALAVAEYAAAFPTRLALARWMRGGDIPHVYSSTHDVPLRAAWYAQAQRQFQVWLDNGGFHGEQK